MLNDWHSQEGHTVYARAQGMAFRSVSRRCNSVWISMWDGRQNKKNPWLCSAVCNGCINRSIVPGKSLMVSMIVIVIVKGGRSTARTW